MAASLSSLSPRRNSKSSVSLISILRSEIQPSTMRRSKSCCRSLSRRSTCPPCWSMPLEPEGMPLRQSVRRWRRTDRTRALQASVSVFVSGAMRVHPVWNTRRQRSATQARREVAPPSMFRTATGATRRRFFARPKEGGGRPDRGRYDGQSAGRGCKETCREPVGALRHCSAVPSGTHDAGSQQRSYFEEDACRRGTARAAARDADGRRAAACC